MLKSKTPLLNIHTFSRLYIHTLNLIQKCRKNRFKRYIIINSKHKKATVAILIPAKRNFKRKSIVKGKEANFTNDNIISLSEKYCKYKCS